jgi:hypothetical protein
MSAYLDAVTQLFRLIPSKKEMLLGSAAWVPKDGDQSRQDLPRLN